MTISSGNKILWSDIENLYTTLKTQQNKFGVTQSTTPSNPGLIKPTVVSDLKTAITDIYRTSSFVNFNHVKDVINMTVPTAGSLIQPNPFTTISSTLTTLNGITSDFCFSGDFGGGCGHSSDNCFSTDSYAGDSFGAGPSNSHDSFSGDHDCFDGGSCAAFY